MFKRVIPNYKEDINELIDNQCIENAKYYPLFLNHIDDIVNKNTNSEIKKDQNRLFFTTIHDYFIKEYIETYRSYCVIDPIKLIDEMKHMVHIYLIGFLKYKYMFFGETYVIRKGFCKTHHPINYIVKEHGIQLLIYYLVYKNCYDNVISRMHRCFKK